MDQRTDRSGTFVYFFLDILNKKGPDINADDVADAFEEMILHLNN